MTIWNKYQRTDGEWAEVGAFILEASANGSWVVRHKLGLVPCRASADLGATQPAGIEGAKAACEMVLASVLTAPNGIQSLASTAALVEQRAITLALCRRYAAARLREKNTQEAALVELDERVAKYLSANP